MSREELQTAKIRFESIDRLSPYYELRLERERVFEIALG